MEDTLSTMIVRLRMEQELSRRMLSILSDVPERTLMLIETGQYNDKITVKQLTAISEELGADFDELCELI